MIDIKTIAIPKREGNSGGTTVIKSGGGSGNSFSSVYLWGQYFDGTSDVYGDIKRVRNLYASGDINAEQDVNAKNLKSTNAQIQQYLDLVSNIYTPQIRMGTDTSDYDNNISIHLCNDEGFYFTDKDRNLGFGIMPDYLSCGLDIGSSNFYTGVQGWRITNDGTAEFQNLKVNGNLDVYSITYNEMKATNGILLVTDAAQILKVVEDENTGDWIFTTDEFPPFAQDDIVQVQYKVSQTRIFQMKGEVVSVAQDGENTVRVAPYNTATGFSYNSTSTSADRLGVTKFTAIDIETCQGKYLIRIGNKSDANRQTIIKLNPYDGGYIDFLKDCSTLATAACNDSTANANKGKSATRLGELTGIEYNNEALSGYGLYSDNVYLTGGIKNLDNKWQLNRDGSGQVAQNKINWDTSGNLTIKLSDSSTLDDVINNLQTEINVLPGQIELSVYDNLEGDLRRTGIDISTGKITLQADNTTIIGNLNITDSSNGITIYETTNYNNIERKVQRINIQPKPIDSYNNIQNVDRYTFWRNNGYVNHTDNTFNIEVELIENSSQTTTWTFNQDDIIDFDNITCQWLYNNSGSHGSAGIPKVTMYAQTGGVNYNICTQKTMVQDSTYYYKLGNVFRFVAPVTGSYKIIATITSAQNNPNNYQTYYVFNMRMTQTSNAQTYIGIDGFYSRAGAYNMVYAGNGNFTIQQGLSGLRIKQRAAEGSSPTPLNGRIEVAANVLGSIPTPKPNWVPIWNYTPLLEIGSQNFTQQAIFYDNYSFQKYAYKVNVEDNYGIIWVSTRAMDNNFNYQESWIVLPNTTYTPEGETSVTSLPNGYTVTIINDTDANIFVTPYRGSSSGNSAFVIRDANRNYNQVFEMGSYQAGNVVRFIKVTGYAPYSTVWFADKDT